MPWDPAFEGETMRERFLRYKASLVSAKTKVAETTSSWFIDSSLPVSEENNVQMIPQLPPESDNNLCVVVPARELPPRVPAYTVPKNNMVIINDLSGGDNNISENSANNNVAESSANNNTSESRVNNNISESSVNNNISESSVNNNGEGLVSSSENHAMASYSNESNIISSLADFPPPPSPLLPQYLNAVLEDESESYRSYNDVDINIIEPPKDLNISNPLSENDVNFNSENYNGSNPFFKLNETAGTCVSSDSSFHGFQNNASTPDNGLAAVINSLENEIASSELSSVQGKLNINQNPELSSEQEILNINQSHNPFNFASMGTSPRARRPPPAAFTSTNKSMMLDLKKGQGMFADYSSVSFLCYLLIPI